MCPTFEISKPGGLGPPPHLLKTGAKIENFIEKIASVKQKKAKKASFFFGLLKTSYTRVSTRMMASPRKAEVRSGYPNQVSKAINTSIFIAILSVPWVNTSIPILSVIGFNTLVGP